ncbi:MAG: mercuric reductase [Blastocatellales bacterium]|nr:mercuric reductase [Blastocatellales bacterium]
MSSMQIEPLDDYNLGLIANVHPEDWRNPAPKERYHLVVIGAGTAGLVTAAGAAGLGARVALVERGLMGGDCLNFGCVPSKTLIRSGRICAEIRNAAKFGIIGSANVTADFGSVMERVRSVRSGISKHDSARRFADLGVDVFFGNARFDGAGTVDVDGLKLKFRKAVIATGARAAVPNIPGLSEAGFLTNETVFNLTELPSRLLVIGGGPIGCELAQAFGRLGSEATIVEMLPSILDREDSEAVEYVLRALTRDGIKIEVASTVKSVSKRGNTKCVVIESAGGLKEIEVDEILLSVGRAPNVEGLGLDAVGVEYDLQRGVIVNEWLQTTNALIYAAGDVAMSEKFTHAADAAARIVIQNTLFLGRKRLSELTIPRCTYTDPEIAQVGLSEAEARARGQEIDIYRIEMKDVDRAVMDGEDEGFVKILTRKGSDRIVGATIVARSAGDLISEITLAIEGKIGLGAIARVIHPYPTQAEAIRRAGDAYNRTRLTPFIRKLFGRWLAWSG